MEKTKHQLKHADGAQDQAGSNNTQVDDKENQSKNNRNIEYEITTNGYK